MLLVVALIVLTAEWLLVSVMIRGRCFETASVVSYAAVAFVIMLPCEGGNLDLFRLDRLDSNDEVRARALYQLIVQVRRDCIVVIKGKRGKHQE